ncbi:MAG: hypothetical protein ABR541_07805 [Candidatus Dormibacteria bacterium]
MTLSAAAVALGVLVVLASAAAVLLPRVDAAVVALLVAVVLAAAFEAAAGASLLAAVQLLATGGPIAVALLAARRSGHPLLARPRQLRPAVPGAAAAVALGVALVAILALGGAHWAAGIDTGSVARAVRHSGLVGGLAALAGLLVCAAGTLAVGRVDPEEQRHERGREERLRREERARRRREDRVAARAARPQP